MTKPKPKPATATEPEADQPTASPFSGQISPSEGLTIDERMANLLEEHEAMGARPADDSAPVSTRVAEQPGPVETPEAE